MIIHYNRSKVLDINPPPPNQSVSLSEIVKNCQIVVRMKSECRQSVGRMQSKCSQIVARMQPTYSQNIARIYRQNEIIMQSELLEKEIKRGKTREKDNLNQDWVQDKQSYHSCVSQNFQFFSFPVQMLFLSDPTPIIAMLVTHSLTDTLTHCCLVNLIDVTLACEDLTQNLLRLLLLLMLAMRIMLATVCCRFGS